MVRRRLKAQGEMWLLMRLNRCNPWRCEDGDHRDSRLGWARWIGSEDGQIESGDDSDSETERLRWKIHVPLPHQQQLHKEGQCNMLRQGHPTRHLPTRPIIQHTLTARSYPPFHSPRYPHEQTRDQALIIVKQGHHPRLRIGPEPGVVTKERADP